MKKISLLPLVAALAIAGTAQAQTAPTVTVYGQLDAFLTNFSDDHMSVLVNEGARSRLGFRGEDKLNNGMTAFFQLEERFNLDENLADTSSRWKDKAWVGLKGGFGEVILGGAIPTALDVIYGGSKAANQDTIADVASRKAKSDGRVTDGLLYTSPALGPVTVYVSVAASESVDPVSEPHAGIAANISLGSNAYVEVGFQRDSAHAIPPTNTVTTSNLFETTLINGGFKVSPTLEIIAAIAESKGFTFTDGGTVNGDEDPKMTVTALGAKLNVAGGLLTVTLTRVEETNTSGVELEDLTKLGVAFGYPLSSRTTWLSAVSLTDQTAAFNGEDEQVGIQTGLRIKF